MSTEPHLIDDDNCDADLVNKGGVRGLVQPSRVAHEHRASPH